MIKTKPGKSLIGILLLLILAAISITSIACAKKPEIKDAARTGYPEGEIQNLFIYYDGRYWMAKDFQGKTAESDYKHLNKVGTTLEDHIYKIPPENLHTARIEVGSPVFADAERNELIVLQKNNTVTFREMDPEEEAELIKTMDEDEANRK